MIEFLLVLNCLCFSYAADIQDTVVLKENKNNGGSTYVSQKTNAISLNRTFIDKSDNVLRIPNTYYEEKRQSKIKKSPKRTIQKIIKKNNLKRRRIFVQPVTRLPTESTVYNEADSIYSRHDEDAHTTEANSRKRAKKNSKVLRYPMPFQRLQPRSRRNKRSVKGFKTRNLKRDETMLRSERETGRDDNIMILKDLDEIEFVGSDNKDYNFIRAHVQNYW